ncbi:hypothetical protein ASZ78_015404 [Callipepla squamata]|uniref:Uncharacterized protein n=1 Tax=Callipepla squamata TaxID=9009 RepID=A0A226N6B4_CALSU|nr:hypothetical protein ASZ78_015404 [Callipepla squamata]
MEVTAHAAAAAAAEAEAPPPPPSGAAAAAPRRLLALLGGSDVVIGDVLVLLGASLYAISNVSEEYIVKNLSRVEFLGMVGLFGTIISGLQLAIVEHRDLMKIQWNWKIGLYILSFVIIMVGFILYCSTPTQTAEPTTVPQPCNAGLDNAALKLDENDIETPAVAVPVTREESVVVSTD